MFNHLTYFGPDDAATVARFDGRFGKHRFLAKMGEIWKSRGIEGWCDKHSKRLTVSEIFREFVCNRINTPAHFFVSSSDLAWFLEGFKVHVDRHIVLTN
jgi:hypothetical protein